MNQAVTELIVRGRTEGVVEARTEVEALDRAHVKAQETTEKATLGMERMSARVQSRLDPQFRATQQLAKVEGDLNLLREKGLITQERHNALLAAATQRYAAVGTAARGAAVGMAAPGQAAQLSAFQMQNLTFQMNDIATGLATGQSPFRIMAQQGGQIVQVFGSGTGVVAAVKAAGTALTSFLLNPLTLAALGFGLALEAGMRFFSSLSSGASDAKPHLDRHKELIDQIGDAWPEAAGKMREYARESRAVLDFQRRASRDDLVADVQAEAQKVLDQTTTFLQHDLKGDPIFRVNSDFAAFAPAIEALREQLKQGTPDFAAFRLEVQRTADLEPTNAALRANGAELIALSDAGFEAERGIDAGTAAVDRISASAERAAKELGKALEQLRGVAAVKLSDRDQAGEQLRQARGAAGALPDVAERRSAVETAVREYEAAMARITGGERQADLEGVLDARFRLSTIGLSDYAKGLAEINREFDVLIAKHQADGADTTLLERQRGLHIDIFNAERQGDFNDAIAERQRALAEEAGALGLSEAALAKYRAEIELTNDAMRLFGSVSPEMAAQISALGDAAARSVEQQRAMRDQIAAMDDLRGDVRSFLGDLVKGMRDGESAADALRNALNRLLDRLMNMGLDMIVAGLFGQQGTAGGGMLGNLFAGLFGGSGSGASAAATSLTGGSLLGGGGSDVLIGGAGGGLRSGTPFASTFAAAAAQYGLEPSLLAGMARQESGFNPNAVSSAGAQGLMQLMPGTARDLGVTDAFDPTQNIFGGAQYMRQQIDRFGSVDTALAAYNAGPGRVAGAGGDLSLLPAETQAYVPAVLEHQKAFVEGAGKMADATTQAADTLAAELPQAASQMSGTINAVSQAISAAAGGGGIFGGFGGGGGPTSFFGTFLGAAGFGGAPGFTPAAVFARSRGGPVWGAGSATSDSIPALLSNGEYVINAEQTRKFFTLLEAINDNRLPGFFVGGMAGTGIGGVGAANPGTPGMGGTSTGGSNSVGSSGGSGGVAGGTGHGGISGSPGGTSGGAQAAAGPGGVGSGHAGMGPGGLGGGGGMAAGLGGTGGMGGFGGLGGLGGLGGFGGLGGITGNADMPGLGGFGAAHGFGGTSSMGSITGNADMPGSAIGGLAGAASSAVGLAANANFGTSDTDAFGAMSGFASSIADRISAGVSAGMGILGQAISANEGLFGSMASAVQGFPSNVFGQDVAAVAPSRVGPKSNFGDLTGLVGPKADFAGIVGQKSDLGTMAMTGMTPSNADPTAAPSAALGKALNDAMNAIAGAAPASNPFGASPADTASPPSSSTASPPSPATDRVASPFAGYDDVIDDIFAGLEQANAWGRAQNALLGFHHGRIGGVGGGRDIWEELGRAEGGMVGGNDPGSASGAGNLRLASPAWFRNAVRAHGGLRLAPDERPIIAQTGERILNRAETADYEGGGRRGGASPAAPSLVQYRGGDLVIQGNVDETTLPLIRREIAASEARQQREMASNFGQYQGRWSTLKAS